MRKTTGTTILVLALLLVAACSTETPTPAPTAIPTPDLNPLRTEVAATVLAQIPQILALTPSATQVPPATATFPATTAPTETSTQATGTGTPQLNDHATWVSQTVQDDTVFTPGQAFTMTWRIQNNGTSTWTAGYLLRFYSGDALGAPKEIALGKEVKPGETVDINADMKAPAKPGDYRSDWVLSNEVLRNFKEPVFLKIKVASPPTSTSTPKPTATATITPTP